MDNLYWLGSKRTEHLRRVENKVGSQSICIKCIDFIHTSELNKMIVWVCAVCCVHRDRSWAEYLRNVFLFILKSHLFAITNIFQTELK